MDLILVLSTTDLSAISSYRYNQWLSGEVRVALACHAEKYFSFDFLILSTITFLRSTSPSICEVDKIAFSTL